MAKQSSAWERPGRGAEHQADVEAPAGERLTVGTVQKEIRVGMSGAEVATVLGSTRGVDLRQDLHRCRVLDQQWRHRGARPRRGRGRGGWRRRQRQTRRIDGISEKNLLVAPAGVLQDLGFNIDESETRLGVIVASKDRFAFTPAQLAGAIATAVFGAYTPIDKTQKIRVSLVTRPALASDGSVRPDNQVTRVESIEEPEIYRALLAAAGGRVPSTKAVLETGQAVGDPKPYQDFFTAHQVD